MANQVTFEGKRELRWLQVGTCLVTYMEADIPFHDTLWDQWLEAVARTTTQSLMICAWGATEPTNQQWRRANRQMRDQQLTVAVVTEARHNAALAKAASWLGTNIKSFRWGDLHTACEFVGYDRTERIGARAKITALRDRFGTVTNDETHAPSRIIHGRGLSTCLMLSKPPRKVSRIVVRRKLLRSSRFLATRRLRPS